MHAKEVILVEDNEPLLQALETMLVGAGYRVTALRDAEALLDLMAAREPAGPPMCVLMDVHLGALNGVQAHRLLKERVQQIAVVFMSGEMDARTVKEAWREGACNFLFKPFTPDELLESLRQAFEREAGPLEPAQALDEQDTLERLRSLTERQQQILPLLAQGQTHAQIADAVGISSRTVKMHRAALMQRLGLNHITDLARFHEACKQLRAGASA